MKKKMNNFGTKFYLLTKVDLTFSDLIAVEKYGEKEKNLILKVKHGGGSVMVWGSMAAAGVGNLVLIQPNC